jgi:hypothetical protein
VQSPAGEYCTFCEINKGCEIYNVGIPAKCKEYKCAYAQMKRVDIKFRPDKCHIIFERVAKDIMFGLLDSNNELDDQMKGQIQYFIREGLSVMIMKPDEKPLLFVNRNRTAQSVYNEVKEKWLHLHIQPI